MAVRLLVFDNTEAFIGEVSDIRSLTRVEEINGEHSLTFTTPMELAKQNRVLYRDSQDAWHEYVIAGVEQTHDEDAQAVGTYFCVWSLQYDLEGTIVKTQPGKVNPVTSTVALTHALAGTARWTVGSVTQNTTGGASMYYLSGWEALGQVVEVWGGEVSVTISVDDDGTILSRQVNLLDHLGSAESVRRFDYSADMQSIVRTVEDAPFTCRITPRGAAVESENGGYGRKIDITSVNGGVEYLEDPDVVDIVKLPDGNGGWEYPNQVVEFDGIEDPQTLYDTAMAHLHDFTRPRVSYEAEVVQLAAAGMNPHGIALGDAVDVVDKAFTPAGLRLTGRVTRAEWDDLDPANNAITIGFNPQGFAGQFQDLQADIRAINDWRDTLTTEEYIEGIIDRLNDAVNATGGYTYLVPGIGMVTYDVAVTDPAVGAEASAAVEIRGGTIRIADSKDAQGNWEWRTVFTAGHIAGELVTAAQIVTGYIGSAGSTFIDLDNNIVQLGDTADNSITVSDAGISFNGIGGSKVGFIDSGNTMAVGYKRVESLTSEQVEDVKDGGTATIFMAGWEEPDFADGDLTLSIGYYLGSWIRYSDGFTFSGYGTQHGNVFDAELVAASGSDPWKIVLSLGTLVPLSSASIVINWWADGPAPRVAFGGDTTGDFGFAVNYLTHADGYASFAAGNNTQVTGGSSAAFGGGTKATGNYQMVLGKWNATDSTKLLIVGNGSDDATRSNALTLDGSGNLALAGSVTATDITISASSTTTINDVATAASGYTVSAVGWSQWGKIATMYVQVKNTNALSANTLYNPVATLVSGKRPLQYAPATLGTNANNYGNAQVNTNGNLAIRPSVAIAAGSTINIRSTFIVA